MLRIVDTWLDGIAMYTFLKYYLYTLLGVAIILSAVGALHFNPLAIVISVAILATWCWVLNWLLGWLFKAPLNGDSSLITGLILALIITPQLTLSGMLFVFMAGTLAQVSKYILAIHKRHLFNPAAIAVVITALVAGQSASWWVGNAPMLPFVAVGGLLLARKVRRLQMTGSFFAATTLATGIFAALYHLSVLTSLQNMLLSSAVVFLGFVMLTEPQTSPTTRGRQLIYAALVGVLLPPQVNLFGHFTSPEIALVIGNIFTYLASPTAKVFPRLVEKSLVARDTLDFIFEPNGKVAYRPGQYMEWTLPHAHPDARGSRRYFTLASSPTEATLRIGVKFYDPGSSFKRVLKDMTPETPVVAAQVAGDFVLSDDKSQRLAFIAGGIGVTPFRSMIKYLMDTGDKRSVTMLYAARKRSDVAYGPLLEEARQKLGIQVEYILSEEQLAKPVPHIRTGTITSEVITDSIPDYQERIFYISGTHPMVQSMQQMLRGLGVPRSHIKTDFFPGYV